MHTTSSSVDVTDHLRLVRRIVHRVRCRIPVWLASDDDLFQEGVLGLLAAAERFDPGRGVRFSSFAYYHIRGAMLDHARASWRALGHADPVEIPAGLHAPDRTAIVLRAVDVRRRLPMLSERQRRLVDDWAEGRADATRAREESKHRCSITRERHRALAVLRGDSPPAVP